MAKRKSITRGWSPPRQGTKKRAAMPRSAFLMPSARKYPYKTKVGGKWVASRAGTQAAFNRARQQGATSVAKKARNVQRRHGWLPASAKK